MPLPPWLMRAVRIALQVLLSLLLLSVVVGVAGETGPIEKVALIAIGAALVWVAVLVTRLGSQGSAPAGAAPRRGAR